MLYEGVPRMRLCREFAGKIRKLRFQIPIVGIGTLDLYTAAFLCRLERHSPVVGIGLSESTVMSKVVAHPEIGHRRLRRRCLQCRMRIEQRDRRGPTVIR